MAAAERKEILNIPLKAMYQAVTDYAAYSEFVTGMKKSRVVGPHNGGKKAEFEVEMIKRISYSLILSDKIDESAGTAEISWTLDSSDFMKKNDGRWNLRSLGPNQTEVIYTLEVEFNFPAPGFILKGLVSNSLPVAIREFSDRAAKLRG